VLDFLKSAKKKENRPARRKQNSFARKGWQEFILRGISADQALQADASARSLKWSVFVIMLLGKRSYLA
jgi:hypothetical protein